MIHPDEFDESEIELEAFNREDFNLVEFKELLKTVEVYVKELVEKDKDYQGEADDLIESIQHLQNELKGVHDEEKFLREHFKSLLPHIQVVMQFVMVMSGMDEEDDLDEDEYELSPSQEIHEDWISDYEDSDEFQELSEEDQDQCKFILTVFCDILEFHDAGDPDLWSQETIDLVCLEDLPQRFIAKPVYFNKIASYLVGFFNFLSENDYLEQAEDLKNHVQSITKEMVKRAADSTHWAPEKKFGMDAINKDPSLEDDLDRLMALIEKEFHENEVETTS